MQDAVRSITAMLIQFVECNLRRCRSGNNGQSAQASIAVAAARIGSERLEPVSPANSEAAQLTGSTVFLLSVLSQTALRSSVSP